MWKSRGAVNLPQTSHLFVNDHHLHAQPLLVVGDCSLPPLEGACARRLRLQAQILDHPLQLPRVFARLDLLQHRLPPDSQRVQSV